MSRHSIDLPAILAVVILIAGAVVRFCYSDANSYWLDELYSVFIYGVQNESAFEAVDRLARSIHPPLYQFLLYNWMTVFGDGETATRSLSNLFIAGATLCLYLSVRKVYGAWLGVVVTLVFTLMYTPTYFGMETRSYAQSIFLSSLSTLLLIYALPRIAELSSRRMATDGWVLGLLAANTALLLTHYYNVFFLGAQGLFLIVYLLPRSDRPATAVAKSLGLGLIPVVVLLAVWGSVMIQSYEHFSGSYTVRDLPKTPWDTLRDAVKRDFQQAEMVYAVFALFIFLAVTTIVRLARRPNEELWLTLWFLLAASAPVILAFVLFLATGHERYSSRYFSYSIPPLTVVVVMSLYEIAQLVRRRIKLSNWAALAATALLAVTLAAPGGLAALEREKRDWRGIAAAIVERVRQDPNKRFAIYETVFRSSTLDYYLGRYSDDIRVHGILRRPWERKKGPIEFAVPDADHVIVAFTHHRPSNFPRTLEAMESVMTLSEEHLSAKDRGYLVFSVPRN